MQKLSQRVARDGISSENSVAFLYSVLILADTVLYFTKDSVLACRGGSDKGIETGPFDVM